MPREIPPLFAALTLVLGCTAVVQGNAGSAGAPGSSAGASSNSGGASGAGAGNAAGAVQGVAGGATVDPGGSGLPCEVTTLLQRYCVGCHSSPPVGGAPQAMLTYADLDALATLDPSKSVASYSVTLMQSGVMPPQPAAAPSAVEQASFSAWVSAGLPKQGCTTAVDAGVVAMNPYDTPLKCTSGTVWTRGDQGSSSMHPGDTCIACHSMGGDGPSYAIAGTVFPSAHEPTDCNGTGTSSSGALSVKITEATGTVHTLPVNSVGNFYYRGSLATPYSAEVVAGAAVRVMTHTQVSGDCNGCHTETGASNSPGATSAPGRIMAP
jgi:hypothetical protein